MKAFSIKRYAFYLCLAGSIIILGAIFWCMHIYNFKNQATVTQGKVIAFSMSSSKTRSASDTVPTTTTKTYSPVVRFTAKNGNTIEFTSKAGSNPPAYSKGETVEVLYLPSSPEKAKINDFKSLWMWPFIVGGVGLCFWLLGGGIVLVTRLKGRRNESLRKNGIPVKTEFQRVERNENLTVGGRKPYQVITQWTDPSTSAIRTFKSDNLWYDPADLIDRDKITVYMASNNPKKYYVDLTFLSGKRGDGGPNL